MYMMNRKNLFFALLAAGFLFLTLHPASAAAQVVPSAFRNPFSLTVGATVSGFNPDYTNQKLGGVGAYADLNLFHGLGIEAEGRWQRFHELDGIHQDNYLIGPRFKVKHFWIATPYVKVLGGFSNMTFENDIATGRFTTVAAGGGADFHLSHRWSVRADGEYQIWPAFLGSSLSPYGASVGIGYRIF
jgi:opacity protein-like surface antigen